MKTSKTTKYLRIGLDIFMLLFIIIEDFITNVTGSLDKFSIGFYIFITFLLYIQYLIRDITSK